MTNTEKIYTTDGRENTFYFYRFEDGYTTTRTVELTIADFARLRKHGKLIGYADQDSDK